jgi:hypothetical protein
MTIFGPGVGECIVLHVGNGDWIIVDSCTSAVCAEPAAIDYLIRIGVDPASSVRLILATHWHDDHIQGLARTLRECPEAQFAMSAALAGQQFIQLVLEVDAQNRLVKHNSSASEFAEILDVLASRASSRFVVGPNLYAQDGSRLFRGGYKNATEVWALSPSAATITNALAGLADRLVTAGEAHRFKRFTPNDLSVAIVVQTGQYSLLLGADLETTTADEFGWKSVLNSTLRPRRPSEAIKIGHHGSANADHEGIWTTMLVQKPIAVVTPFAKLSDPHPTTDDVERVRAHTDRLYCTTWPPSKKPSKRRGVDGIVQGATKSRRAINQAGGHVRLRLDLNDASALPTIELFGSAKEL